MSKDAAKEIYKTVAAMNDISEQYAKQMITQILDLITKNTLDYGRVRFHNHIFRRVDVAERIGMNPKTGEKITVSSKVRIKYKNTNLNK